MAGKIKNTVQTDFISKGASKTEKDFDQVGRAQTRLGQSSAGAGRQFAAQASGLGGLVAAYAGAAATVFALEAAFNALAQAAAAENIVKGTSALARETGQVGNQILANIKRVTDGQLALAQSAEIANLALSAGFNTDQIDALIVGANKASKALGRDLTDSINRIVRGTAKLEPELLDELGLFVRIESASAAYARQIGKTADSLTEFERRQAFLIAAQTQLETKFGNIDTSSASAQKSFEQLKAVIDDLSKSFGQFIANVLLPLVDFFKEPGNQLLLFGGILTLVFGKSKDLITGWATTGIGKLTDWADKLATTAQQAKGNLKVIEDAQNNLNNAIQGRGGLSKDGGRFNQQGVTRDVAVGAARARASFLAGGVSPAQQKKDIAVLKAAQSQLDKTSAAYKDAGIIINSYETSLKKASLGTRALTKFSIGLQAAARGIGVAMQFAGKALNVLFLAVSAAQLIGTFFDIDILQKIKGLFVDLSQAAANLKDGIEAVFTSSGDSSTLVQQLRFLGASDEEIADVGDQARDLFDQIDRGAVRVSALGNTFVTLGSQTRSNLDRLNSFLDENNKVIIDTRTSLLDLAIAQRKLAELRSLGDTARIREYAALVAYAISNITPPDPGTFENFGVRLDGVVERSATNLSDLANSYINYATVLRDSTQREIDTAEAAGENTTQLKIRALLLDNFIRNTERYGLGIAQLAGDLGRVLEIPANQILGAFDNDLANLTQNTADSFSILGVTIQRNAETGALSIANLTNENKELVASAISTILSIKDLSDSIDNGTATSDRLSAAIVGYSRNAGLADEQIDDLRTTLAGTTAGTEEARLAQIALDTALSQRANLQNKIDDFIELRDALVIIEQQYKGITAAFSSEIKFGTTAAFEGLINAQGQFAKNEREQQQNRLTILGNIISGYQASADAVSAYNAEVAARPGEDVAFNFAKSLTQATREAEVFDQALKAIVGTYFDIFQETQKLAKELDDIIISREIELTLLNRQIQLLQLSNSFELQGMQDDARLAAADRRLKLAQTELETQGQILDLLRDQAEAAINLAENKAEEGISSAQRDVANLRLGQIQEEVGALVLRLDEGQLRSAAEAYQRAIENAANATGEQIAAAQIRVVEADRSLKEAFIQEQLRIFDQETQLQLAKISADADAILREDELLRERADLDRIKLAGERLIAEQNAQTISAQLDGYQAFIDGVNGFGNAVNQLRLIFQSYIDALPDVQGTIQGGDFTQITADSLAQARTAADNAAQIQSDIFDRQNDLISTQLEGNLAKNAQRLVDLASQYGDLETQRAAERVQLELELTAAAQESNNEIADLGSSIIDAGNAADDSKSRFKDLASSFKSAFSGAFNSVIDYIINGGEEGESFGDRLRSAFSTLLTDIATSILDTVVVEPISEFLAQKLTGFLTSRLPVDILGDPMTGPVGGVGAAASSAAAANANAAAAATGALGGTPDAALAGLGTQVQAGGQTAVAQINSTAQQISGALTQLGVNTQTGSQSAATQINSSGMQLQQSETQLGTKVQMGAKTAVPKIITSGAEQATAQSTSGQVIAQSGAAASAGIMAALTAIWPILLILGITSLFSKKKASGGFAQMALGGSVKQLAGGGMLRDRVPALLEPGEFVIRRPAAKAIGGPVLQQMNATGTAPTTGNISVNIKNEGTPMEASAKPPRFDGEKYVVDIITRDLRNNGPIRQSIRAGGSR